jgi:hypothetical protein
MDCYLALPLGGEYPFLDLPQMDCYLALEHQELKKQPELA